MYQNAPNFDTDWQNSPTFSKLQEHPEFLNNLPKCLYFLITQIGTLNQISIDGNILISGTSVL